MMKKIIFSLAILAAASFSMMAADNNTNSNPNSKPKTECCKGKECKGDRADRGMKAFEGLNLTDAQKSKIEELQKNCQAERKQKMDAQKGDKQQKEQLTAEQKQQRKTEMQAKRREAKQNYLKSLQAILTPEQYTQFLENNFMAADKGPKSHGKDMKKGNGNRGDRKSGMQAGKDSRKGQKGSKGNRSNATRSNA